MAQKELGAYTLARIYPSVLNHYFMEENSNMEYDQARYLCR